MRHVKSRLSRLLLVAAALASFYLAMQWSRSYFYAQDDVIDAVEPQRRERSVAVASTIEPASDPQRDRSLAPPSRTAVSPDRGGEAFAVKSWLPPPAPVVVAPPRPPPPPPVPTAPPLPFAFVGMVEKGTARPQAFLAKGEMLLIVGVGDVIDNNTYRVDSLSSQQIAMTYLPLNTPQTLNISGGNK